jgi:hypothetical protein
MNITLRKASALQTSINESVKGLQFDAAVKINEFQDGEAEIVKASDTIRNNIQRRSALISALYEVRKSVSVANAKAGIDSRLADVAHLEKEIQFYTGLAANKVREDSKVIAGRLEKLRSDKGESRRSLYGYSDTVDTTVFTTEDLDGFRKSVAKAKKSKQKLQDEILELNVQTQIVLSADAEKILQTEGLI